MISVDTPEDSQEFRTQYGLSFPMLSDGDRATIIAYDVLDPTANISKPATFVIDSEGIIRWKYVGEGKVDRPKIAAVLEQLDALPK